MTTATIKPTHTNDNQVHSSSLDATVTRIGDYALRYSVVIVLAWIGAMKFTAYEAGAIEGLVASSPLSSWLYSVFSLQGASNLIGTIEIATAIAIVLAPFNKQIAIVGSLAAIATFTVTSSYLVTAPVWEASLGGFPALNVVPGQFLLKDLVLLAAAITLFGKALRQTK